MSDDSLEALRKKRAEIREQINAKKSEIKNLKEDFFNIDSLIAEIDRSIGQETTF